MKSLCSSFAESGADVEHKGYTWSWSKLRAECERLVTAPGSYNKLYGALQAPRPNGSRHPCESVMLHCRPIGSGKAPVATTTEKDNGGPSEDSGDSDDNSGSPIVPDEYTTTESASKEKDSDSSSGAARIVSVDAACIIVLLALFA